MVGVIDVGGGERGIYGAGVFDRCLDLGISFDCLIGVSAGSANQASFLAGQRGRNYIYYTEYAFRKQYMSFSNFIKKGSYLDLDYIYGVTANRGGDYPLDYETMVKNARDKTVEVVATDAETGAAVYFTIDDEAQDDYDILKCSSNVPVVNKAYPFRGRLYYDGGISDPVPVQRAFDLGCDRAVVILTKPRNFRRSSKSDRRMSAMLRKYPKAAQKLAGRAKLYNDQVDLCEKYAAEGKVLIVAPDDIGNMKTLTKDLSQLKSMYEKGLRDAEAILSFIKEV